MGPLNVPLMDAAFYADATVALDFTRNRYRVGSGSGSTPVFSALPNLTVTRASVGYAETAAGALVLFGTNTARITDKGLLTEEARTNLFLNSFAPVTQNVTITATSHTITVWGSGSVTVAAGTATISNGGAVTAGSPRTIGCTGAGTISVTVTGSPTAVQVEAGAFGTSPIPTTGATATRAADGIGLTGLSYGSGTSVVVSALLNAPAGTSGQTHYEFSDVAGTSLLIVNRQPSNRMLGLYVDNAGVNQATFIAAASVAQGTITKTAARYVTNDMRSATDNVLGTADALGTIPTVTRLAIGSNWLGVQAGNIYLRSLIVYPRALTDAELLAATA